MIRTLVSVLAVITVVGSSGVATAGPPEAGEQTGRSEAVNRVTGLQVDRKSDGTYLRLESSETPSFSVFKLKNPLRLVVDVSNSRLDSDGAIREIDDAVISQVSLLESQKRDGAGVRLIVGFERPAHYDVRTEDEQVVIFVEGVGETPGRASEGSSGGDEERLAETRKDVEKMESEVEQVRGELDQARDKISTLRGRLKEAKESSEKRRLREKVEAAKERASGLEAKLERKSEHVASLREKVQTLEKRLSDHQSKAKRRARELEELREKRDRWNQRLEAQKRKYRSASREVDDKQNELEKLRAELERLREERDRAEGDERERLQAELEERSEKLQERESELESKREAVESLKSEVQRLERQRDEARERVAALKQRWKERLEKSEARFEQASEKLDATRERLENAKREIRELREKKAEATGEVREKLEAKLADKTSELESMKGKLADRRKTVAELRGKVERLEDQKDQWNRKLEETRDEVERAKAKLEDYRSRLSERDETISKLERRIASLEDRFHQTDEQKERLAELQEKLKGQRREVEDLREARSELKSRLEDLRETKRQAQASVREQRREAKEAREKLETYEKRLDERDREISALKSKLAELREEGGDGEDGDQKERIRTLEEKLEQRKAELESLRDTRAQQKEQLVELRGRAEDGASESSGSGASDETRDRAARAVPVDEESGGADGNAIEDIRLETNGGTSRIVVDLEQPGTYKRLPWKKSRAVMLLKNVDLPERLEQTIAAGESGAVRFVSSYSDDEGEVRMEAELDSDAREKIQQEGDKIVWEFAPKAAGERPRRAAKDRDRGRPERPKQGTNETAAPPSYPRTVTNPAEVDGVPEMSRKRLKLDLRDADIQNVLRLFAKEGRVNIIAGDISGTVTLSLKNVPLDEAFLIVLQSQGLGFEKRGQVIRVATQEKLLKEKKARREAEQRAQKTRPLEVFLLPVNYAQADDMTEQVERLLSPRGSVSVDERTNTLIIKDLPENIRSIRKLVGELDSQVPQVLIEARIVETNDTFSQEFGIQWGGDFTMSQGGGNPTGLIFPNVLGAAGGATDGETPTQGTAENPNFAVNLPAAAGTGSGGALGLTMGSVSGSVNLNLRLSAAEESGRAKIISAPKILTLDNREATISQGTSIPISVVSAAGVQTVFVDATLELTVTPHVTPDGNVQMEISATKNEPDFQNTGARGDPTIIRKQAETELLIEDGETTVIGGIYTRNTGTSVTGIPVLHQIPILGLLFKSTSQSERRTELLIFITPRVVNRAEAIGNQSAGNVVEGEPSGGSTGGGGGGGGNQ